jgi:hypothetical protein
VTYLSVPATRRPRHDGGRWETVRYALDSNARTFRLCLILLMTALSPVAAAVVAVLIHHMLLCAPSRWCRLRRQAVDRSGRNLVAGIGAIKFEETQRERYAAVWPRPLRPGPCVLRSGGRCRPAGPRAPCGYCPGSPATPLRPVLVIGYGSSDDV